MQNFIGNHTFVGDFLASIRFSKESVIHKKIRAIAQSRNLKGDSLSGSAI